MATAATSSGDTAGEDISTISATTIATAVTRKKKMTISFAFLFNFLNKKEEKKKRESEIRGRNEGGSLIGCQTGKGKERKSR